MLVVDYRACRRFFWQIFSRECATQFLIGDLFHNLVMVSAVVKPYCKRLCSVCNRERRLINLLLAAYYREPSLFRPKEKALTYL